jgi:predicted nuclease of predicted toxin-antitoxin system
MASLYLDADVPLRLAGLLTSNGHPTRTTQDEDRKTAGDDEQLLYAARQGWVLITHNKDDFLLLHDAWRRWGMVPSHAGILLMEQAPADELAPAILALLGTNRALADELWGWNRRDAWVGPRELRWAVPPDRA